jgi:amino acid transporter
MTFVNYVGLKYVAKTGIVFLFVVLIAILCMYLGCFTAGIRGEGVLYEGITGLSLENF